MANSSCYCITSISSTILLGIQEAPMTLTLSKAPVYLQIINPSLLKGNGCGRIQHIQSELGVSCPIESHPMSISLARRNDSIFVYQLCMFELNMQSASLKANSNPSVSSASKSALTNFTFGQFYGSGAVLSSTILLYSLRMTTTTWMPNGGIGVFLLVYMARTIAQNLIMISMPVMINSI